MVTTSTAALLLQIHQAGGKHSELVLSATFAETIAFHTWYTMKTEQYPDPAALKAAWQADVFEVAHHIRIIVSVGRSHAECAQALEKLYTHIAFTDPPALLITPFRPSHSFTDVPQSQDLLRHVLDRLMVTARRVRQQSTGLLSVSEQAEDSQVAAFWMHSEAISIDTQESDMQIHSRLLQSMLLAWKLAWIAGCVSRTVQTPDTMTAITTLFEALEGLCGQLKGYDQSANDADISSSAQAESPAGGRSAWQAEAERNMGLSLVLVSLVKETFPAVIGGETPEADVCCKIMSALMVTSLPSIYQAVAKTIVARGALATALALFECVAIVHEAMMACSTFLAEAADCMDLWFQKLHSLQKTTRDAVMSHDGHSCTQTSKATAVWHTLGSCLHCMQCISEACNEQHISCTYDARQSSILHWQRPLQCHRLTYGFGICCYADGLAMLLKACHTTKPRVHAAFQVLCDLTNTSYMPGQQARDNTVSMTQKHGVHTLCNLLCPEVSPRHHALGAAGGLM